MGAPLSLVPRAQKRPLGWQIGDLMEALVAGGAGVDLRPATAGQLLLDRLLRESGAENLLALIGDLRGTQHQSESRRHG